MSECPRSTGDAHANTGRSEDRFPGPSPQRPGSGVVVAVNDGPGQSRRPRFVGTALSSLEDEERQVLHDRCQGDWLDRLLNPPKRSLHVPVKRMPCPGVDRRVDKVWPIPRVREQSLFRGIQAARVPRLLCLPSGLAVVQPGQVFVFGDTQQGRKPRSSLELNVLIHAAMRRKGRDNAVYRGPLVSRRKLLAMRAGQTMAMGVAE